MNRAEPERPVGHHQVYHQKNTSPRRTGEKEAGKIFEEMVENASHLIKDKSNTQEAQQIPSMTNLKSTSMHVIIRVESQL